MYTTKIVQFKKGREQFFLYLSQALMQAGPKSKLRLAQRALLSLFDSLQLSGVLLGNVYCVSEIARSLETQNFLEQVSSSKDG